MKLAPLIDSVLIVVCIALIPGVAEAQAVTTSNDAAIIINFTKLSNNSTVTSYLQPLNLICLAYQGGLKLHGIPSGGSLVVKTQNRNIIAKDLVKAGVDARILPPQVLNNYNYLNAVNSELTALPDYAGAD
ncbi:hypothetical protein A6770_34465 [Nostoc minutum NIES-26]|uniref:Uncharacterized protein n=1 Tax=Nostoc minutum NIES-26 TaxID=1844469 RepID=A0A367S3C2_9NOSO|nr:hypothetical protein A6770_34465 [Nostoc minutum NIES-26]